MHDQHPSSPSEPSPGMTGRAAYNVVTDTVTGANLRLRDNVLQALAILACLILGSIIGALAVNDRILGGIAGGFAGLLLGLFGSGVFLMVYRVVRHARGQHD